MKIAHPELIHTLEWDALHPAGLVIEHPTTFLQFVSDLTVQEEGGEGLFVISEKEQILSVAKSVLLVRDLWALDINQKKLLNGVLGQLKQIAQEEHYPAVQEISSKMSQLIFSLMQESMLPLVWDEQIDAAAIFRVMGVRMDSPSEPFERLVDYVHLAQEFLRSKLVILVGIRSYLNRDEMELLCRDFASREMPVLFLDGVGYPMVKGERRLIVDPQRCELMFS